MKKVLTLLLLLACITLKAQWGLAKKETVDALKSRTLIVVVEEPNAELMKKLDAAQKEFYSKDVEEYNISMKELMPKYWKWNDKVEFKTRSEVEQLVKSKSKLFAYIENTKYKVNFANKMSLNATQKLKKGELMLMGGDYAETAMAVRLTDENSLGNPVYGIYLPSVFPSKGEMVFALKQLQLQLKYKSQGMKDGAINSLYKENAKQLVSKTLLLSKEKISLSEAEVKKVYPFTFQIVDMNRIEQAFLSDDATCVTFVFVPRAGGIVSTYVVDTNEGMEMGRTSNDQTTGFSISTPALDAVQKEDTKGTIRKDDLKIIAKQAK